MVTWIESVGLWIFKKEWFFLLLLEYGYMRSNLGRLGGYPTHRDIIDMSSNLIYFRFVLIWSRGMTHFLRYCFSKRASASLARRKLHECVCTNLNKKELNLFLLRGYEHVSSLTRWNRLYINMKIYYHAYYASPLVGIFFPHKHPVRK